MHTIKRSTSIRPALFLCSLALATGACVVDDGLLDVGDDAAEDTGDGATEDEGTTGNPAETTGDDGVPGDEGTTGNPGEEGTSEETTEGGSPGACSVPDPGWGSSAALGAPAPHFGGTNQFGDDVNICAYEGNPILIDTSAVWCGPCQMMSMCLGGQDNLCVELFGGNQGVVDLLIDPLRTQIEAGTFAWVTVITEDGQGAAPTNADAVAWDQNYPGPEDVWVIADEEQSYYGHLPIEAFPSFWLIGPDMNWEDLDQSNVFNTIIQTYL